MLKHVCKILETGSSVLDIKNDKGIHVFERDAMWQGELSKSILDFKNFDSATFGNGGLWSNYDADYIDDNDLETESRFIDIYNSGLKYPDQPFAIEDSYLNPNNKSNFIGVSLWEKEGVFLSTIDGEVPYFIEGKFFNGVSRSKKFIYVRKRSGEILCLDELLSIIWSVGVEKKCFSDSINQSPQYFKKANLVIVNVGEKPDASRGAFELNGYNADDGQLVWSIEFKSTPCTSSLIEDKVYVIVRDKLAIVDAATGKIDIEIDHNFTPFDIDTKTYKGSAYPFGNSLLTISPSDRKLEMRTKDGLVILQTIIVPEPYTPKLEPFVIFGEKAYLPLKHIDFLDNTMKGAFMVLVPDENAPAELEAEIEARPPMSVDLITNSTGESVYQVTIEHDDLDDVIRFSTIALKETAFKHGSYETSTETNPDHHGQLVLQAKVESLAMDEAELLEKLAVVKERAERNLKDTGVIAGDGKSNFVVDIQLN